MAAAWAALAVPVAVTVVAWPKALAWAARLAAVSLMVAKVVAALPARIAAAWAALAVSVAVTLVAWPKALASAARLAVVPLSAIVTLLFGVICASRVFSVAPSDPVTLYASVAGWVSVRLMPLMWLML